MNSPPFGTPGRMIGRKRTRSQARRVAFTGMARQARALFGGAMRYNKPSRSLRLMGMGTQVHSFRRAGTQLMLTSNGLGAYNVNGTPNGSEPIGLELASISAGLLDGTSQFGGAFNFKMSNVARFLEITSLFDNYKIQKVTLRFDYAWNSAPNQTAGSAGPTNSTALPVIHIAEDTDDHVVPSSQLQLLENSKCRTYRLDNGFSYTIYPKCSTSVLSTGGTSVVGGTPQSSMWLDSTATNVIHDGCKFWLSHFPNTAPGVCGITITPIYYLEAKNVS